MPNQCYAYNSQRFYWNKIFSELLAIWYQIHAHSVEQRFQSDIIKALQLLKQVKLYFAKISIKYKAFLWLTETMWKNVEWQSIYYISKV